MKSNKTDDKIKCYSYLVKISYIIINILFNEIKFNCKKLLQYGLIKN